MTLIKSAALIPLLLTFCCYLQAGDPRIVSLAPSLTEIICALGAEQYLVGVTDYCLYPASVTTRTKVGGYLNPNVEVVSSLTPDLVFALPEHRDVSERLEHLGMKVVTLRNWNLDELFLSITEVGRVLNRVQQAQQLTTKLLNEQSALERKGKTRPKCLLVLGSMGMGDESIEEVYLVARNGFLNDLLVLAGGENIWQKSKPYFPKVGQEVLLDLNPEIIIELVPQNDLGEDQVVGKRATWARVPFLKAAQANYHIIAFDHVLQAGPRYIETLRQLTAIMDAQ